MKEIRIMPKIRDPLSKSRITKWHRSWKNPYLADIVSYLEHTVFHKLHDGIEDMNSGGHDIEYRLVDDAPWYVVTPTETRIFELEMKTSSPQRLIGGKMWLRLIIDGRETNFDLEVEWNEITMKINIDKEKLSALAANPMWKEEPKISYLEAPSNSLMGGEKKSEKSELQKRLESDMVSALASLGERKKEIDMQKVERIAEEWAAKDPKVNYNDLIGKAVMAFFQSK